MDKEIIYLRHSFVQKFAKSLNLPLNPSGWGVPMYSGPDGFIDNISHDITQIFSNTDPKDKAIAEYGFFWPADWACS